MRSGKHKVYEITLVEGEENMALKDKNKSRQRRATTCPKSPKNTPRLDKNTSRAVSEEEFIETMSTMVWLALLFGDGWAYHITPLENLERIKTEGTEGGGIIDQGRMEC